MKTAKWRGATYEVWGNADDGYDVNDVRRGATVDGPAEPTDLEAIVIGQDAGVLSRSMTPEKLLNGIDLDGDDMVIYFNDKKDSYPLGEVSRND